MIIMQPEQTNEELTNLFIQSIETKNEKAILEILECDDEAKIRDVINRIPAHHIRKLVLELRNILSDQLTTNHLRWLQQVLILKFSALSSMADSRSIILPLISLLEDRSSPAYYMKMQALKGKLSLLKQLKETRTIDTQETVVRVPPEAPFAHGATHMEIDSESDTDSEEDFDDEIDEEDAGDEDPENNELNDEELDASEADGSEVDDDDVGDQSDEDNF